MHKKPQVEIIKRTQTSNKYPKSLPNSRQNSQPKNTPCIQSFKPTAQQGQNQKQHSVSKVQQKNTQKSPRNNSPHKSARQNNSPKPKQINVKLGSVTKSQDFGSNFQTSQDIDLKTEKTQENDQHLVPSFSQTVQILLQKQQNILQNIEESKQEFNQLKIQKFQDYVMSDRFQQTAENLLEYSFSQQYNEAKEKNYPKIIEDLYKLNSKQIVSLHSQTYESNSNQLYQGFISTLTGFNDNSNQSSQHPEKKQEEIENAQQERQKASFSQTKSKNLEKNKNPVKSQVTKEDKQKVHVKISTKKLQKDQHLSVQTPSSQPYLNQNQHQTSKSQQTNQWQEIISSIKNSKIVSSQANSSPSSANNSRQRSPQISPLKNSPLKTKKQKEVSPKRIKAEKIISSPTQKIKINKEKKNSQTSASLPSGTQSREKSPTNTNSPLSASPINDKIKVINTPTKQNAQNFSSPRASLQSKSSTKKITQPNNKKRTIETSSNTVQAKLNQPVKQLQNQNNWKDLAKGAFSKKQNVIDSKVQQQKIAIAKTKLKELQQRPQLNASFLDPFEEISSVFGEIDQAQQEDSLGSAQELQTLLNLAQIEYNENIGKISSRKKVTKIDKLLFS